MGREGERERERHKCVAASFMSPTGDLAHNPGMCPDWELNQWPFDSQSGAQSTEPQQPWPKHFILMKSHLFIPSFISPALQDTLVKILLREVSEIFLPMFSSRTFMVSQLIFKSFYPPWIYFCVWCKLVVKVQFFAYSCPDVPTPFVKKAMLLLTLLNINWPYRLGFISGPSILFPGPMCLFLCQYQTVLITVAL